MHFTSAIATTRDVDEATRQLVVEIHRQMEEHPLDLALVFLSPHFKPFARQVSESLRAALNPRVLVGTTAEGVIGPEAEIERQPAIAIVGAHLPGVELVPFALHDTDWEVTLDDAAAFRQAIAAPDDPQLAVVMADPFTTPTNNLLQAFNTTYRGLPLIGGISSGANRPGGNALLLNDRVLSSGAVGVTMAGDVAVDVVVSQGCRPIGQPFTVTHTHHNVIMNLEGIPPLERLQQLIPELSEADRELLKTSGLFIGRAIGSEHEGLGRGDFLIRGVIGIDPDDGSMAVADTLREGETIQFHVRDAATAEEDLAMMLATQTLVAPPRGGFLFTCNARGTRLYDHPNGDVSTIQEALGGVDLAGFFCAGEIGPIGGKNFLHGHTASLVLFRKPGEALQLRE
jgi:small ligand-binding sensory domain FIST